MSEEAKMEVDAPAPAPAPDAKPEAPAETVEKKEEPKKEDKKKKEPAKKEPAPKKEPAKKEEKKEDKKEEKIEVKEEKKEEKKEEDKKEEKKEPAKKDAKKEPAKKEEKKEAPKKEDKKEEKKDVKKDEEKKEDEDDEESSSGEELPPGLLERDPRVEGKRQRSTTNRLTMDTEIREKAKVVIPEGNGTPLGEIEHVKSQLNKFVPMQLKEIHAVLFNTPGGKHTLKMDIRKFKGFDFKDEAERNKKLEYIEKRKVESLRFMCDFFNLPRQTEKAGMSKALLEFLEKPHPMADDGAHKPKAGSSKKKSKPAEKSKSSAKKSKSKKKAKEDGPKKAKNAYMCYNEAVRGTIMKDNPNINIAELGKQVGEGWRALSAEEKSKYEKMAEADKQRYEKEKAAFDKTKKPAADAPKKRKAREDDDEKPLKKKAKKEEAEEPTDQQIKAVMKKVAAKVGDDVTFKHMKAELVKKFPGLDIDGRRDELKAMAQATVQEASE